MKKLLSLLIAIVFSSMVWGQTTLISPTGDGGFENGTTFAANGWTGVNDATNTWQVGTVSIPSLGTNAAFISNDAGVSNAYTATGSQVSYFYRDITVPAGENLIMLSFKWKNVGESSYDRPFVYVAPTTSTPVANSTTVTGSTDISGTLIYLSGQSSYLTASYLLPSTLAGTTFRLIFGWRNDGSGGTQPPASIDEISLISRTASPLNGTYTINNAAPTTVPMVHDGSGNFNNFTDAILALNGDGISAAVTFNVTAGQTFIEDCPILTATGTTSNTITFQKSGAGVNPVIKPTGSSASGNAGIAINGGDYITFDGIDITENTGSALEYGYYINNASATNGAQYITVKNCKITLNRSNTSSRGIYQYVSTTPSAATGANSYNKYQGVTIENSYSGIYVTGNASNPDLGMEISNCIVGAATANDIGNGSSSSNGIRMTSASGASVFANEVRNVTSTSTSHVYGIYLESIQGINNVYNNKVHDITLSGTSSSTFVYGIRLDINSTYTGNIYNNFVSGLQHGISTASATNVVIRAIAIGVSGTGTANIFYNSVRIDENEFPTSACMFANNGTVNIKDNIFANFSTAGATSKRYCIYKGTSATLNNVNYNDYYINEAGTNNFVGYFAADQNTLANWQTASSKDANSLNTDPVFATLTDLHSNSTGINNLGVTISVANGDALDITTDIDGQTRDASTPDMGADEFSPITLDMSALALVAPLTTGCYGAAETVTVTVKNMGVSTIDFSVNPTTVTVNITGAVTQTLNATVNTGTLAAGATQNVSMSSTLNMTTVGTYTFNASTSVTGDGNAANDAMAPVTRTVIAPVSLPQNVDFTGYDGSNLTTLFSAWYEATGTSVPSDSTSAWASGDMGVKSAKINLYTNTRNEWIVGPKFTPAANTILSFKVAITDYNSTSADAVGMQGTDDKVVVKVSTDCGASFSDLYTFNAANTVAITNTLVSQQINLGTYAGQQIIIAFYATDGPIDDPYTYDYDFHIDDIFIGDAPACSAPTLQTVSTITTSGATLGWTSPDSFFDIFIATTATPVPDGSTTPTIDNNSGNSIIWTGGSSATTYYWWVRSDCEAGGGTGQSTWTGPISFTTSCDLISTFPYTENFNGVTTPALPVCYSANNANSDGDYWKTYTTYGVGSTICAGMYTDNNAGDNDDYLILPQFTLNGNQRLKFSVRSRSTGEPNDYQVVLSTTTNDPASFTTVLQPLDTVNSATMTEISPISLSAYTGNVWIAIHIPSGGIDGYYLYIDDIIVEDIPACEKPTSLNSTNITSSGATLGWTSPDSFFDVFIETSTTPPDGSTVPTINNVAGNSTTWSGGTPNTIYYYWVRTDCEAGGGTEQSIWAGPMSFYTGYCIPTGSTSHYLTNFTTTGGTTNINNTTTASALGYGDYSATISCSQYAGGSINFSLTPFDGTNYFYIWIDWNNDLDFSDAGETIVATTSYAGSYSGSYTVPSGTPLGSYRMRVANSYVGSITSCGPASSGEYEDYTFTVSPPPPCLVPTIQTVANITTSGATLGWTSPDSFFDIFIATSATPVPDGATTPTINNNSGNSIVWSGGSSTTTYYWWVRTDCEAGGGTGLSDWTGPNSFTTSCLSESIPTVSQGFESTSLPVCWSTALISGTNNWSPDTDNDAVPNAHTGTYFMGKTWTNSDAIVISQPIDMTSSASGGRVNVWIYRNSDNDPTDRIRYYVNTTQSLTGATQILEIFPNNSIAPTVSTDGWYNYTANIPASYNSNTTVYIIAQGTTSASYNSYGIGFDDFIVESIPACLEPTVQTTTNITSNGATLGWTSPDSFFDIFLETTTTPPDGSTIPTLNNVSGNSTTWNGGSPNTTYYWWVRTDCEAGGGTGQSTWTGPMSFYTGYCQPAPSSVDNEGITNVTFSTVNNTTTTEPNNYGDYSAMIGNVTQGATVPVYITYETGYTYDTKIWIDWNDNLSFLDAGDEVYSGTSADEDSTVLEASFTVPVGATLGNHRMRIGGQDYGPVDPCYTGTYGTFEDYTVNVAAMPLPVISGKTRYAGKANTGIAPNPPTYNSVVYDINKVVVILKNYPAGTEVARDTSDALGNYQFSGVPNGEYILSYDKYTVDTMTSANDVNAIDVALVKYFIGADTTVDPSRNFSAKYKKAANVDNNTYINAVDVARIKAKVGAPYVTAKNFPKGNWVAIDTLISVAGSDLNITLKTIGYGDFNASSTKYRDSLTTWATGKALADRNIISTSEESVMTNNNDYFEVPLRISAKMNDFSALGLELNYPGNDFKLVSATMPKTSGKSESVKINPTLDEIIADDNDLLVTDENGVIRVVYATTNHFDVDANDEVIRLGFRPVKNLSQGEVEFSMNGTGVIGDQYGNENEDAYLTMPKIFVQGKDVVAGFDFTGYPNPFTGNATLNYTIPENGTVKLSVYNAIGEQISELVNEMQMSGQHAVIFSPKDLPAGMYTFRLEFNGSDESKCFVIKMVH